ncbi:DUF1439 domain-containing protein [Pseudoduganella sp. GCM10020061]|uniref:DUF1439 domain-containing protein n=1 Tax=Pseudoduganella sp. GCM10020061 TaxID=3317345 RepID=UPI003632C428
MSILKRAAALTLCLLLASCASLVGPQDVAIPLEKIQSRLEERFPVRHRVLEVFEVTLARPQPRLFPETERIALGSDIEVRPPFTRDVWMGDLGVSGRVFLDNASNAVRLREARVDQFRLDGVNPDAQRHLSRLANVLLTNVYSDIAVYNFRPEDLRRYGVQFRPTRVRIARDAIVVTLEPVR